MSSSDKLTPAVDQKSEAKEKKTQSMKLLELCSEITLFHTNEGDAYASIPVNGHTETFNIKRKEFKHWLQARYHRTHRGTPSKQAIQEVLSTLDATARFDGIKTKVFLRTAQHEGKIYLDLLNDNWEAIEVSEVCWKISKNPPVKFNRRQNMQPLPYPEVNSDSIELLRKYVNVESESDFRLLVAWLINALNPNGPFLALVLSGEQGSAKSTTVKVLRDLVDPNDPALRRVPNNSVDLMISAKANWVVCLDNISKLSEDLSDDLCRLATGGGLSKRELFSDDDEIVLNATRPIMMNGITQFVTRGDLASRSIIINLPTIGGQERRREKDFWEDFKKSKPKILAHLLDAISNALRVQDQFKLEDNLRMADAWHWVSAAETHFGWDRGSCIEAFKANQIEANQTVLNASPIAALIQKLALESWLGSPSELLSKLNAMRGSDYSDSTWPRTPKTLTDKIQQFLPALRLTGVEVIWSKTHGTNSGRRITIRQDPKSLDARDAATQTKMFSDEGDACVEEIPPLSGFERFEDTGPLEEI
jgi:hypothetical protein